MFFMTGRTLAPYLLLLVVLVGALWLSPWDSGVLAVAAPAPDERMGQALKSYQRGAFEEAATGWTEAARLYEQAGENYRQSGGPLFLAQASQPLGPQPQTL